MTKKILTIASSALLLAVAALHALSWIWAYQTKSIMVSIISELDLNDSELIRDRNGWIFRKFPKEPIQAEIGLLKLKDGTIIKYAFQSHHLNKHDSISIFQVNHEVKLVLGYFGCEMSFGQRRQFDNLTQLYEFLSKVNGMRVYKNLNIRRMDQTGKNMRFYVNAVQA